MLWGLAGLVFLFVYVEDWGRDWTTWEAEISAGAEDPGLRPLTSRRPPDQMVDAVKMAARRIRNWDYVGEAANEDVTLVYFVRTNRLLRIKDDVTIRIERRSGETFVGGDARSRWHVGDLGRNPRSLRRFLAELRVVLDGSVPDRLRATAVLSR